MNSICMPTTSDQNSVYNLPDDIVEQLRCSNCDVYVSCGPVKVRPNGGTICGRCVPLHKEESSEACTDQSLFESVMAKFTFPCRYKLQGCKNRVLFNQAVEHESKCSYRTICCPSVPYKSCSKNISVLDAFKHFNEIHADLVLKDGKFKVDLQQDTERNLLMSKGEVIVVIQYLYNAVNKTLHLDVRQFSHQDKQVVQYKLQIVSSDSTISLKERQCGYYETHGINMKSATKLVMDNYLPVLENPSFIYINILLTTTNKTTESNAKIVNVCNFTVTDENLQSRNVYEEKSVMAWNLLERFRCRYCFSFIIPPVYYGLSNQCICCECKDSIEPSAKRRRVEIANYPCRWRGCTFMGNDTNIEEHVKNCSFQTYICPVLSVCKEGYYTSSNLMEHMQQHGTYCPNQLNIVIDLFCLDTSDLIKKVYFTILENRAIAFTCKIINNYEWYLSGNIENFMVDIHFEHDHCRFKSKSMLHSKEINIAHSVCSATFPKCFKLCKRISAILRIRKGVLVTKVLPPPKVVKANNYKLISPHRQ